VVRTEVGYASGTTPNPDYSNIGDHSETVLVEYNPERISYEELLAVFWSSHDPAYSPYSGQYRNAVFTLTEDQQRQALESRRRVAEKTAGEVRTAVEAGKTFHRAEDYHQKYLLRGAGDLFRELRALYPSDEAFVASTAAARVNGYLGCNGDKEELERDIGRLGLSPSGKALLRERLARSCGEFRGIPCPLPRGK